MAKAIFTTSESSAYDDQPEVRYHFPKTYLRQAQDALGDWVLYYEPRRTQGPTSTTGRQAYFAVARLRSVVPDEANPDHYYAYVEGFLEFDRPVPFREGGRYYEEGLRKADGSTNKGAFGRAVRALSDAEFDAILEAGFTRTLAPWEQSAPGVAEPTITFPDRPRVSLTRAFRDDAFRRHVREAYDNTCAVSGLRLINGGGRPEVQAAHIQPVAQQGPDSVRNGLALTSTVHWLFDRGLISVDDDGRLLIARSGVPEAMGGLIQPHRPVRRPARHECWPHPSYLSYHREHIFKGPG